MVNPLLTILMDLFIIGSAVAISAAMLAEYLGSREPQVGTTRKYQAKVQPKRRATMHRMPVQRRRAA